MQKQDELKQRLAALRRHLDLTYREFAAPLDVSHTAVRRWETGEAELTKLACLAIESAYGASASWLLEGVGEMLRPAAPGSERTSVASGMPVMECPVISGAPSCGPCGEIQDPGPEAPRFPLRRPFAEELIRECGAGSPATLFFAQCQGESMRPTIHDGDMALINTAEPLRMRPVRDAIYLVRQDPASCDARIKRVRILEAAHELQLLSDAPGFRPLSVPLEDTPLQQLILGRVCWIARNVLADERPDNW